MRTCTQCGETKELSAFGFRNQAAGRRHQKCKGCVAAYGRQHYAANRRAYITRNVGTLRSRRRTLKSRVWRYLAEHPCVDCGETDLLVLEFDHSDPAAKRSTIYRLVQQGYGWATIQAEIERCQVRCANCHRRRTAVQFGWVMLAFTTASSTEQAVNAVHTPRRRPRRAGPARAGPASADQLTPAMIEAGWRVCRWCGGAKPSEQFHLRDRIAQRRHSACAACFNAYRREHYRMNRRDYIQRNIRVLRERGRAWRRRLWEYLLQHPCIQCGESDPVVLDCDHRDPATKRRSVSLLARSGYPWATVLAELAKCDVRCANCHRRRTAAQFDWPKLRHVRDEAALIRLVAPGVPEDARP